MEIKVDRGLLKALKEGAELSDVKRTVKLNGSELQKTMMRNASFTRGYQTGTTKRSINYQSEDSGFTAKVAPNTEYSAYLEYGTRFMASQPFIRPSLNTQKVKFISDLKRLMG